MKFEIFQNEKDKKFYYQMKAMDGEVILISDGFETKMDCEIGAGKAQVSFSDDGTFNVKTEKH